MNMLKTGVCSVSFRGLNPRALTELVKEAELDAIEWGGDVHVPPGNERLACDVRQLTRDAGLEVAAYGSYYKVLDEAGNPSPFEPVLASALALGTSTIRIWAGSAPSDTVANADRQRLIHALRGALREAQLHDVRLALEFHANTLADSNTATLALLAEIDHPNLYTYWQPVYWLTDPAYRLEGLQRLADRVVNLHVFQWHFRPGAGSWGESTDRRPLEEGTTEWNHYLKVPLDPEMDHFALMEFLRDDDPAQFLRDAATLKTWLSTP